MFHVEHNQKLFQITKNQKDLLRFFTHLLITKYIIQTTYPSNHITQKFTNFQK